MNDDRKILERVVEEATGFLDGLPGRRVAARTDVEGVATALRRPLPEEGTDPMEVIEELIAGAEPGVLAIPSGRFFGWVMGGVLPATLAADWLTSTWDQNAGLLVSSPAAAGAEWVASEWLLDLLGLPANSAVGFVTGAMIANFSCLAAARHDVLRRAGWDVEARWAAWRASVDRDRWRGTTRDRRCSTAFPGAGRATQYCGTGR